MTRRAKVELIFLVIIWVVGGAAWEVYRYRVYIESWWWHHEHGEVLTIAGYLVPAPRDWCVKEIGEESQILIHLCSDNRSGDPAQHTKLRFPATVTFSTRTSALTNEKLDLWTSFSASMLRREGAEPVLRKFSLDGETLSCVGGEKFSKATRSAQFYEIDPIVWSCWSSGRLELRMIATEADMSQVWEIVSHIHKKS